LLTRQRRALLLRQLADATTGEMTLKSATSVPKWAKGQLDLTPETATAVLDSLIAEQLVAGSQKGKTKKVAITQAGREALKRLAEFVPQPPPKKSIAKQEQVNGGSLAAGVNLLEMAATFGRSATARRG
jgi:DNA-binding MarR family transcriptional regulator